MSRFSIGGHLGFKIIGILKLVSGSLALVAGFGIARWVHHGSPDGLERAIAHLGLDPHNYIIHELISRVTGIDRAHLRAVQAGTFFYALLHLVEAIGLIRGRDWAGYLVIVATSSLIPFEIYELAKKISLLRATFLVVNIAIVVYLIIALLRERASRARGSTPQPAHE
jgi:uncharacterized membrane protein (DUF2068 family)